MRKSSFSPKRCMSHVNGNSSSRTSIGPHGRLQGSEVVLYSASMCCKVQHTIPLSTTMSSKRGRKPSSKPRAARASASLPSETYSTLQQIAKQKRVSVAWVIREAAERYIAEQCPLPEERRT